MGLVRLLGLGGLAFVTSMPHAASPHAHADREMTYARVACADTTVLDAIRADTTLERLAITYRNHVPATGSGRAPSVQSDTTPSSLSSLDSVDAAADTTVLRSAVEQVVAHGLDRFADIYGPVPSVKVVVGARKMYDSQVDGDTSTAYRRATARSIVDGTLRALTVVKHGRITLYFNPLTTGAGDSLVAYHEITHAIEFDGDFAGLPAGCASIDRACHRGMEAFAEFLSRYTLARERDSTLTGQEATRAVFEGLIDAAQVHARDGFTSFSYEDALRYTLTPAVMALLAQRFGDPLVAARVVAAQPACLYPTALELRGATSPSNSVAPTGQPR